MKRYEKFKHLRDKGWKYDPETGEIFNSWGQVSNCVNKQGYVQCSFAIYQNANITKTYILKGHHFAWYWVNGDVEIHEIDHINHDKKDNRICNLRNVSKQVNQWNRICKGYTYHKQTKKYKAQIKVNNKLKYLGLYNTPEKARQAYLNAKEKYHVIT